MPNLEHELADLAAAERHIERGRDRVERQRELVRRLEQHGHDAVDAQKLLNIMESVLRTFEEHRDMIIAAVAAARKG